MVSLLQPRAACKVYTCVVWQCPKWKRHHSSSFEQRETYQGSNTSSCHGQDQTHCQEYIQGALPYSCVQDLTLKREPSTGLTSLAGCDEMINELQSSCPECSHLTTCWPLQMPLYYLLHTDFLSGSLPEESGSTKKWEDHVRDIQQEGRVDAMLSCKMEQAQLDWHSFHSKTVQCCWEMISSCQPVIQPCFLSFGVSLLWHWWSN